MITEEFQRNGIMLERSYIAPHPSKCSKTRTLVFTGCSVSPGAIFFCLACDFP
jgi:hypothetical protein